MIYKTFWQCRTIHLQDAKQFEDSLNETLEKLADADNVTIETNLNDGFKAFVQYQVSKAIPETIADEYHLNGISFECFNCPLHDTVTDGRTKHANCKYSEYGRIRLDSPACDYFYKMLKIDKLTPIYCD